MPLKEWLFPNEGVYYEILQAQSGNVVEGAVLLREITRDFSNLEDKRRKIKEIEHKGDLIVQGIFIKLNKAFITPIDRDDLSKLAISCDDILDHIYEVINRIYLFNIKSPTDTMRQFAETVYSAAQEVDATIKSLKGLSQEVILQRNKKVDQLEEQADEILNTSVALLFKKEKDVVELIKLKEIYENMEIITDVCKDAMDVIIDINIKSSA
ncbi:MAG: DUF47 family protein [Thaumarchaeota archaeon]|nr:DUF47 family protein [Nitrososphaerota archaeon]